jgi:hypothetical protein
MDLLAVSDPVFVVDLTPRTMEACRADLAGPAPGAGGDPATAPAPSPSRPIRAVALVFAWEGDPVLLPIQPTVDTEMLEAMARLIRMAMLTRRSVANLVTEAGDEPLKRLYFSRKLPRFIYDGVPAPVRHRIPTELQEALGKRRRRRRGG